MKTRRDFLKSLMTGACATLTLCTLCATSFADKSRKPNVLMIVSDDLNDYLGVMDGHPQAKTPNLDKLAGEGVLFANAHSNAPICAPSRASFMTGILPTTSKNYGFGKWQKNPVLKAVKTLPEYFRENGYKAYYTGKVDHQPKYNAWDGIGLKQFHGPLAYNGKETVPHPSVPPAFGSVGLLDGTFASLADIPAVPASQNAPGYTGWWHAKRNKPFRYVNDDDRDKMWDEESADWFRGKIKSLESDRDHGPFFIAFGIMSPHTPRVAPQKYFDMYPLKSLKIPVIKEGDNDDCKYDEVLGGKGRTHFVALKESYSDLDEGLRTYLQAYLACVSFVDDIVGDVMSTLDSSKFRDNTIVILFSDHGYNMGEKDYLFKNSLWEESTRIPFVIRDPRYARNAGKTVDHPMSLIDVYPTLKDLCDLEGSTVKSKQGAELDGHSLRPFLANPESGAWDGPDVALSCVHENYSVRSKNYRYIRYSNGSEELYDHTQDSYEWHNVAGSPKYAEIEDKLEKELSGMIPSVEQDQPLPITVEEGESSTRGSGIAMYRQRPCIPAGSKLSFLGRYDPKANRICFLDPPWVHVQWPRRLHWRIYFSVKTGPNSSRAVSRYLEPAEAESLQKTPAIVKYLERVDKSDDGGRSVPHVRLSLHDAYAGKVPPKFAELDARKTTVAVFCDNLGDPSPAVQQAFTVKPDKKPAPLDPGMIAVFTGEIRPNRPDLSSHQKEQKKLHHFNLKLIETRPVRVNLDEKTAHQAYRDLIAKAEQRLRDICKGEGLAFQLESKRPLSTTWIDERMVVSAPITPRPDFSRKPVPYATASVFFDPKTGKPERITVVRRVHQDPPD